MPITDNDKRQYNKNKRPRTDSERILETAGRIAPRDTDLEEAVLGALMLERDAYVAVCEILKPDSFYEPRHRLIYEAIVGLGAAMKPIDMLTVTEQLRINGTLE